MRARTARSHTRGKKREKKTQLICNLHTIVHTHTHTLSELTHRSHDEESQLHYSKSPEMPQFKKKEKKICRLAEGRDSECRRVESMSKQSESRREPGDTEEAQRIWLSLEP